MTRGAKAVALDDLSFWYRILPALQHFHRIMPDYVREYPGSVYLPYDVPTLTAMSAVALRLLPTTRRTLADALESVAPDDSDLLSESPPGHAINDASRLALLAGLDGAGTADGRHDWSLVLAMESGRIAQSLDRAAARLGLTGTPATEVAVPGCGEVEGASIDIVWDRTLLEMKVTKSPQSVRDLRQVLMYAGLALISGAPTAERVGLVNPRHGWLMVVDLDELLALCGGLAVAEFRDELADHLQLPARSN